MSHPVRIPIADNRKRKGAFLRSAVGPAAALATLLFVHVGAVSAEDNFRMTMTGCQPDSASIQNDTCRSGGHGVFAKRPGATCRLICPMPKTNSSDQWDGLQLMGKDPDGTGRLIGSSRTLKRHHSALPSRRPSVRSIPTAHLRPATSLADARDPDSPVFDRMLPPGIGWRSSSPVLPALLRTSKRSATTFISAPSKPLT